MSGRLQFGIPSFDALFGREHVDGVKEEDSYNYEAYGISVSSPERTTSMCFIGPDGTGKSVFGLHLAAQFKADHCAAPEVSKWSPLALYVSTDLRHDVANVMWTNFGLDHPNDRDFPFFWGYRRDSVKAKLRVELAKLDPRQVQTALEGVETDPLCTAVQFVDLVSTTMGDDWSFVSRLLAVLPSPPKGGCPHLLVMDAVEGFETLVGEKDAFGETTSRRSRIAQIMRAAGDKCHVCFIVEEPKNGERFPEEFVTDIVVRFRTVDTTNYARRTVEVIKARGQQHVRGQHAFAIRGGSGSTTGEQENADEPKVENAYVHVYPSLHRLSREEMKAIGARNPERNTTSVAAFGITYLDEMLARLEKPTSDLDGLDDQGLRAQTTTALIGEIATQKTSLATAFLARTFRAYAFAMAALIRELRVAHQYRFVREALATRLAARSIIDGSDEEKAIRGVQERVETCIALINSGDINGLDAVLGEVGFSRNEKGASDEVNIVELAAWLAEAHPETGAAVLITTSNQDQTGLVEQFGERWLANSVSKALGDWPRRVSPLDSRTWEKTFRDALKRHMQRRTVCRRLELHDLSSPILIQIIQRSVEKAQEEVFLGGRTPRMDRLPFRRSVRFRRSSNIRVVIDDLSTLKDTYPEIGSDPLFLPFLLSYLELEGVTSLIIDSQFGRPDMVVTDTFDHELRALVPHKLLTWRVPFYGGLRDAITLVPPYPSGLHSLIREVRWESKRDPVNALIVDPELELYAGVEKSEPTPIPLQVRMYVETNSAREYVREENEIFAQLFTPVDGQSSDKKIIVEIETGQYNALRDFCNLQTDTLLNYTLVFQVDEFWASNREGASDVSRFPRGPVSRREGALYPLGPYMVEVVSKPGESGKMVSDRIADPFGLFQGETLVAKDLPDGDVRQRRHYFTLSSQGLGNRGAGKKGVRDDVRDRLSPEKVARIDRVPFTWDFGFLLCPKSLWDLAGNEAIRPGGVTVSEVWAKLPNVVDTKEQPPINWRTFLGACEKVSAAYSRRSSLPVRVLDVSTLAPESFVCLVLEIWASEIFDALSTNEKQEFINRFSYVDWNSQTTSGLIEWLNDDSYLLAFYKTWLLLMQSVSLSDLVDEGTIPRLKSREVDGNAVATRHWYKTACGQQICPLTKEVALPVRLPGHFSMRGDWFLAVAGGSRSERLGRRALDLLSSRRANFRRLELGIGLPTREISPGEIFEVLPTALSKRDPNGRTSAVTYKELIGAGNSKRGDFAWFWRSQLRDYHRHSRFLHKWMGQMLARWQDLKLELGPKWRSGFDVYDDLAGKTPSTADCLATTTFTHQRQLFLPTDDNYNLCKLTRIV
jgi:KaiC/GvpD/RAD55 family RecA-like ATPase